MFISRQGDQRQSFDLLTSNHCTLKQELFPKCIKHYQAAISSILYHTQDKGILSKNAAHPEYICKFAENLLSLFDLITAGEITAHSSSSFDPLEMDGLAIVNTTFSIRVTLKKVILYILGFIWAQTFH